MKSLGRLVFFMLALLMLELPSSQAAQPTHEKREAADSLDTFVHGIWEHGVSYSGARALGPRALPRLRRWLRSDSMRPHWSTIVWTIGYIGDARDFRTLRDFLENRFVGKVDDDTFQALLSSIHVMGHIAAKSDEATAYLCSATDPVFFKRVRWRYPSSSSPANERNLLLSKLAINALSSTGRPEAERVLQALLKKPYDQAQHFNITEGIERCQAIARVGRDRYFAHAGEYQNPLR